MVNFALDILNFILFPFKAVSPLIIVPAAFLVVSGAFGMLKRFMSRS